MGRLLLIDVVSSVAVLVLWYFVFSTYNRKKGAAALRWVQTACAGKGRILEAHWVGSSLLQARLHFPSRWFENARVTVNIPASSSAGTVADELLASAERNSDLRSRSGWFSELPS